MDGGGFSRRGHTETGEEGGERWDAHACRALPHSEKAVRGGQCEGRAVFVSMAPLRLMRRNEGGRDMEGVGSRKSCKGRGRQTPPPTHTIYHHKRDGGKRHKRIKRNKKRQAGARAWRPESGAWRGRRAGRQRPAAVPPQGVGRVRPPRARVRARVLRCKKKQPPAFPAAARRVLRGPARGGLCGWRKDGTGGRAAKEGAAAMIRWG